MIAAIGLRPRAGEEIRRKHIRGHLCRQKQIIEADHFDTDRL